MELRGGVRADRGGGVYHFQRMVTSGVLPNMGAYFSRLVRSILSRLQLVF